MNNFKLLLLFVSIALVGAACSKKSYVEDQNQPSFNTAPDNSNAANQLNDMPSWVSNIPDGNDEESEFYGYYVAVGSGLSSRRDVAYKKAQLQAETEIVRMLEQRVDNMRKQYLDVTSSGDEENIDETFTEVSKTLASQKIRNTSVDKTYYASRQNGKKIESFVLVKVPKKEALAAIDNALKNSLSKDEELYVKFKASKGYEEMKKELEEYNNSN